MIGREGYPTAHIIASELKDPICHSNECQIGSFSSESAILSAQRWACYVRPLPIYFILLVSSVKTLEVKVIEFRRMDGMPAWHCVSRERAGCYYLSLDANFVLFIFSYHEPKSVLQLPRRRFFRVTK